MTFNTQINNIADTLFGRTGTTIPATYWIGLSTTTPNVDGTGITEVPTAGTGYARVQLPNNKTALTTSMGGQVWNVSQIMFAAATSS